LIETALSAATEEAMKIRVLRNLGKGLPKYFEGESYDVDDTQGEDLIKKGLAEPVASETPAIRGVATPPEIAEPKPVTGPGRRNN
jgi:hypothetical protein